jgi:transposase
VYGDTVPEFGRGDLTHAEWARLQSLLPGGGLPGGRWSDHRTVINGILVRLRTGTPWRDVPAQYGPRKTVYERHRRVGGRYLGQDLRSLLAHADAEDRIIQTCPQARVLILTTFDLDEYAFAGLKAGASGFLLKNTRPEELLTAIRTRGRGQRGGLPSHHPPPAGEIPPAHPRRRRHCPRRAAEQAQRP